MRATRERHCRRGCLDPATASPAVYPGPHCTHKAGRKRICGDSEEDTVESVDASDVRAPAGSHITEPRHSVNEQGMGGSPTGQALPNDADHGLRDGDDVLWASLVPPVVPSPADSQVNSIGSWTFGGDVDGEFDLSFLQSCPDVRAINDDLMATQGTNAGLLPIYGSGFEGVTDISDLSGLAMDTSSMLFGDQDLLMRNDGGAISEVDLETLMQINTMPIEDINTLSNDAGATTSGIASAESTGVPSDVLLNPSLPTQDPQTDADLANGGSGQVAPPSHDDDDPASSSDSDSDDEQPRVKRRRTAGSEPQYTKDDRLRCKHHSARVKRILKYCRNLQAVSQPYIFLLVARPETVLAKNGNVTCFRSRMMAQAESTEEANFTDIILSCLVKDAQRNTVSRDNARILNEQVSRTLMEREEEKVRRQQAEAELAAKAKELELIKSQLVALQATSDSGVAAGAA